MIKNLPIESERLKSKELLIEDVPRLYQIYSDKEAMKFRGSSAMTSIADAHNMIKDQSSSDGTTQKLRLGLLEKVESSLIGTLLVKQDNDTLNECEIGISIDKNYWNKGYGTEAITMLVNHLQEEEKIEKLKAWCKKENTASCKVFERLGFTKEDQTEFPESNLYILCNH